MLNRRDFLKAGAGLSAITIFPYDLYKPLILKNGINNLNNHLLKCAYCVIQKIPEHDSIKTDYLCELSLLYAKNKFYDEAHKVLAEAIEIARKRKNISPFDTFRMAEVHCYMGEYEQTCLLLSEALKFFYPKYINRIYFFASELTRIAKIFIEKEDKDKAECLFDELLILPVKFTVYNAVYNKESYLLFILLKAYCNIGEIEKAEEIADEINDMHLKTGGLYYIAACYVDIDRKDKAYKLLEINTLPNRRCDEAVTVYAKLKEYKKAISHVEQHENPFVLIDCPYITIAKHAVLSGDKDIAIEALNKAIKATEKYDKQTLHCFGTNVLLEAAIILFDAGDSIKTCRLIDYILQYTNIIPGKPDDYPGNLSNIAVILIKMGNNPAASKLIQEVFDKLLKKENNFCKIKSLLRIAKAYIENNIPINRDEIILLKKIAASV